MRSPDGGRWDSRRDAVPADDGRSASDRGRSERERDRTGLDRRRTEAERMSERAQKFAALPPPSRGRHAAGAASERGRRDDRTADRTADRPAGRYERTHERDREQDRTDRSRGGSADPRSSRDTCFDREAAAGGHARDTRSVREDFVARGGERRHQGDVVSSSVRGDAEGRFSIRGGRDEPRHRDRIDNRVHSRCAPAGILLIFQLDRLPSGYRHAVQR